MESSAIKKTSFSGIQILDVALFFWAIFFGEYILPLFSSDIDVEAILNPRESNHSVVLGIIMLVSVVLLALSIIFSPGRPAKMFSENYMKKTEAEKRELNRKTIRALPLGFGAIMFTFYAVSNILGLSSNHGMFTTWTIIILLVFVRGKAIHQTIRRLLTIPYILISSVGLEMLFTNYVARSDISIADFLLASPFIPIYYAAFIYGPRWIAGDKSKLKTWAVRFAIYYAGLFISFI
ncbi:MAG: hypothetical protein C0592_14080 [Marinilabiliales bacterium]|nr:MAG: hypothetical protein C0592_14080 [Marinilabiliales bacterium]